MTKHQGLTHQQLCAAFSNRILLLALLGICCLTLFPFQFHFWDRAPFHRSPFLLGPSVKPSGTLDYFLNVLLFIPFGFGVSAEAAKRESKWWTRFFLALALGAFVSYTVEFLQLFITQRDSGWTDVISNSLGSVAGWVLFELAGGNVLGAATALEHWFERWLSTSRAALVLSVYFTIAFGVSVLLQRQTRLTNWDTQSRLVVGNDAAGKNPWNGNVFRLQIWNRALRDPDIRRVAAESTTLNGDPGLVAEYNFATGDDEWKGFPDRLHFLPELRWTASPRPYGAAPAEVNARSWLDTKVPVENLVGAIRRTNQFTVRVTCSATAPNVGFGRIVSISQSVDNVNFHLRQDRGHLAFYFRSPLSEKRSALAMYVPSVFDSSDTRDIFAVYDGSDAFVYVDGRQVDQVLRLGPGVALGHTFQFVQAADLDGYVVLYEILVFLPGGALLGLAARKRAAQAPAPRWLLALGFVVPVILLELLLSRESGRQIWMGNLVLSLIFAVCGALFINADERAKRIFCQK